MTGRRGLTLGVILLGIGGGVQCAAREPQPVAPPAQQPVPTSAAADNSAPRPTSAPPEPSTRLSDRLSVQQVVPGVWVHISTDDAGTPANGILVSTAAGLVLVDTTWNDAEARQLLDWCRTALKTPVVLAVVTHSHADRSGGLRAVLEAAIPVETSARVAERLPAELRSRLNAVQLEPGAARAETALELFYPGPGHSPDNLVLWFPGQRVLFGGCLVKAADAASLGFTGDADLEHWPQAVKAVLARYPSPRLVVPGHGPWGDTRALNRTLELLESGTRRSTE